MNLPYTMTPAMVADAARAFRPKVLYLYHFGETDTAELARLLAGEKGIEMRVRKMKVGRRGGHQQGHDPPGGRTVPLVFASGMGRATRRLRNRP